MAHYYHIYEAQLRLQLGLLSARKVRKVMDDVQNIAQRSVGPGPLATSIFKSGPKIVGWHVTGTVGTSLDYAASVEGGSGLYGPKHRAYAIFPKGVSRHYRFGDWQAPQLKFAWRGKIVYTPHVPMALSTVGRSHPGQRGKHFLRNALAKAAIKHNMRFEPRAGSL